MERDSIKASIIDQQSGKKYLVQIPIKVKVGLLLPQLIQSLNLPTEDPRGELHYVLALKTEIEIKIIEEFEEISQLISFFKGEPLVFTLISVPVVPKLLGTILISDRILIRDIDKSKNHIVRISPNIATSRVLPYLIEDFKLPRESFEGEPIKYTVALMTEDGSISLQENVLTPNSIENLSLPAETSEGEDLATIKYLSLMNKDNFVHLNANSTQSFFRGSENYSHYTIGKRYLNEDSGKTPIKYRSGQLQEKSEKEYSVEAFTVAKIHNHQEGTPLHIRKEYQLYTGILKGPGEDFFKKSVSLPDEDIIEIDVTVFAQDMEIAPDWFQKLYYYRDRDSGLLNFRLTPQSPGQKVIRIDFYYQRHWLQFLTIEVEVEDSQNMVPLAIKGSRDDKIMLNITS